MKRSICTVRIDDPVPPRRRPSAAQRGFAAGLAAFALAACATRPGSIPASFVSHEKFMELDCPQLQARLADTRAELDQASKLQDEKADGDAVGVFLLLIPFSKLSGDHAADVARLKGSVEAIETAQVKKQCRPA